MAKSKTKASLILAVSHQIFLTREERYTLASGKQVKVICPSVPVWFYRGATSEPATEVFCRYTLTNKLGGADVKFASDGYKINIPQLPLDYEQSTRLSNEEWMRLSEEEQEKWYAQHDRPICGKNLLDLEDGGGAYIRFQLQKKMKKDKKLIDLIHYVTIQDIKILMDSLEP